ncbi:MAG: S-layer homology domain-containing protein [Eubacteriales bacterium]
MMRRKTLFTALPTAAVLAAVLMYLSPAVFAECDHVFTDWVVVGDALYRECTICKATETKDIPDHVCAGGEWQTNAIQHYRICSVCGERLEIGNHSFGDWTVSTAPTADADGEKERVCSVCGYRETAVIPKEETAPEPEPPESENPMPDTPVSEDPISVPDGSGTGTPSSSGDASSADTGSDTKVAACPFSDIDATDPYYEAVCFVSERELFIGIQTEEGLLFAPDRTITRAMFVTVLGRMAGIDVTDYRDASAFSDVVSGEWYAPYAVWANGIGIVLGYDTGLFGVDDTINIEQAAVIMARYAAYMGLSVFDASYKNVRYEDADEVSAWAAPYVGWCLYSGIYEPEDARILPRNGASRAFVAELLYRYSTRLTEE